MKEDKVKEAKIEGKPKAKVLLDTQKYIDFFKMSIKDENYKMVKEIVDKVVEEFQLSND